MQGIDIFLTSIGIIVAAITILGFVVYFNNPKSVTNKTFLVFSLLTIGWGSFNFLSYQIHVPPVAFWLLRMSIFTAVWHSFFLFQLLYVFPNNEFVFPKYYTHALIPLVSLSALLNLTPLTFDHVQSISPDGRILTIQNGPGIIIFALVILTLIISAIWIFVKKIRSKTGTEKKQLNPILYGIIVTFTLIVIFNFIFPAFLNNSDFVSSGAFFVFPFLLGTGYAIFKHQFLNVKVISTEILTLILALVIFIEVVVSKDFENLLINIAVFILVIILGILLIKSVVKEVRQREQLEVLTKQLELANDQLKVLDQARAEFISIASHQLRTPPATVKWYLSALLQGDYGPISSEVGEMLKKAERTNNSLISLIEDLLNVSRIERGKMEFLFEPVNLQDLADLTFEQLAPIAQEKHLELQFEKPSQPMPVINADKEKLRQVMNNMIDNAIKYTKQGSIKISLNADQTNIRFQVADSGKGISKEDAAKIFEKFSRGKESIKQSAGLGLGLYVAKVIIEQHKGKIWAESDGEGKGSRFIFEIPIHNNLTKTTLLDLTKNQKA